MPDVHTNSRLCNSIGIDYSIIGCPVDFPLLPPTSQYPKQSRNTVIVIIVQTLAVTANAIVSIVSQKPQIKTSDDITDRTVHVQSQPLFHSLSFGNQLLLACPMHYTVASLSAFPIDMGETKEIKGLL